MLILLVHEPKSSFPHFLNVLECGYCLRRGLACKFFIILLCRFTPQVPLIHVCTTCAFRKRYISGTARVYVIFNMRFGALM